MFSRLVLRGCNYIQRRSKFNILSSFRDGTWFESPVPSTVEGTGSPELEGFGGCGLSDVFERLDDNTLLLSETSWIHLADYFSWNGHHSGLSLVSDRMHGQHPQRFAREAEFRHFRAQLIWINRNIVKAVSDFDSVYTNNEKLRECVTVLVRRLILRTCLTEGAANMNLAREFALRFAQCHQNWSALGAVWLALFISPWDADQRESFRLIETHKQLRHHLKSFIPHFGARLLACNALSDYQRLLENALQFDDMSDTSATLIRHMFDHYYKIGHKRGCKAVFECAEKIDVKLTPVQLYRYSLVTNVKLSPSKLILDQTVDQLPYRF